MKNLLILLCLSAVLLAARTNAQNDTLFIQNLKITPDTTVAGIQGVTIMFSIDYSYDTSYHETASPSYFSSNIEVYQNEKPVPAVSSTNAYKLDNGNVGCDVFPNNRFFKEAFIHIPYYAMQLPEGQHKINIRFSATFSKPNTENSPEKNVFVQFNEENTTSIKIPAKEYFKVLVNQTEAFQSDFDGRGWDYFLSERRPPDMKWKVVALGNNRNDYFYTSSKVRSSYTAEWTKYSEKICISKGDKIHILVVDNDPSYDDLIADICVTLEELIEISEKGKVFQVGKLSSVQISAQRLNE